MRRLLVATKNPAKLASYRLLLSAFKDLAIVSPKELLLTVSVDETGKSVEENAKLKAHAYCLASKLPTLGIDESLYIDGFSPDLQPGLQVRRIVGKDASDEQMLAYYGARFKELNDKARQGHWHFAQALCFPNDQIFTCVLDVPTYFARTPQLPIKSGYPLDSFQFSKTHHKYYTEFSQAEKDARFALYFKPFLTFFTKLMQRQDLWTKN